MSITGGAVPVVVELETDVEPAISSVILASFFLCSHEKEAASITQISIIHVGNHVSEKVTLSGTT